MLITFKIATSGVAPRLGGDWLANTYLKWAKLILRIGLSGPLSIIRIHWRDQLRSHCATSLSLRENLALQLFHKILVLLWIRSCNLLMSGSSRCCSLDLALSYHIKSRLHFSWFMALVRSWWNRFPLGGKSIFCVWLICSWGDLDRCTWGVLTFKTSVSWNLWIGEILKSIIFWELFMTWSNDVSWLIMEFALSGEDNIWDWTIAVPWKFFRVATFWSYWASILEETWSDLGAWFWSQILWLFEELLLSLNDLCWQNCWSSFWLECPRKVVLAFWFTEHGLNMSSAWQLWHRPLSVQSMNVFICHLLLNVLSAVKHILNILNNL